MAATWEGEKDWSIWYHVFLKKRFGEQKVKLLTVKEKKAGRGRGIDGNLFKRQVVPPKRATPWTCRRIHTFSAQELSDTSEKPWVELGYWGMTFCPVPVQTPAPKASASWNKTKLTEKRFGVTHMACSFTTREECYHSGTVGWGSLERQVKSEVCGSQLKTTSDPNPRINKSVYRSSLPDTFFGGFVVWGFFLTIISTIYFYWHLKQSCRNIH